MGNMNTADTVIFMRSSDLPEEALRHPTLDDLLKGKVNVHVKNISVLNEPLETHIGAIDITMLPPEIKQVNRDYIYGLGLCTCIYKISTEDQHRYVTKTISSDTGITLNPNWPDDIDVDLIAVYPGKLNISEMIMEAIDA